jgi:hypothetical protein
LWNYIQSVHVTVQALFPKDLKMTNAAATARAEKLFKKQERAVEGEKAMAEYVRIGNELRTRTAKLKALRLSRDAAAVSEMRKTSRLPRR